jgi:hypothetical protein
MKAMFVASSMGRTKEWKPVEVLLASTVSKCMLSDTSVASAQLPSLSTHCMSVLKSQTKDKERQHEQQHPSVSFTLDNPPLVLQQAGQLSAHRTPSLRRGVAEKGGSKSDGDGGYSSSAANTRTTVDSSSTGTVPGTEVTERRTIGCTGTAQSSPSLSLVSSSVDSSPESTNSSVHVVTSRTASGAMECRYSFPGPSSMWADETLCGREFGGLAYGASSRSPADINECMDLLQIHWPTMRTAGGWKCEWLKSILGENIEVFVIPMVRPHLRGLKTFGLIEVH